MVVPDVYLHVAVEDFVASNLSLVFTEAGLRQCITITVIDDSISEVEESLLLELTHPGPHSQYELLQERTAVFIKDNDGK